MTDEPLQFNRSRVSRWAGLAGGVVVTVDADAVESALFNTPQKRFAFAGIRAVTVDVTSGGPVLRLELAGDRPPRGWRQALNGVDPSRPSFPLAALEVLDQERLVDAIQQRIGGGAGAGDNVLRQERLFAEQLKALAPRTWVTWGLVAANVAAWLASVAYGADPLSPSAVQLLALGGSVASEVQQGEWWRLLSATFLHIGVLHLAMNMLGLLLTAPTVERIYGHGPFLLLYAGAALAGSATSLHFAGNTAVSVGASGAVFGVAGALLVAVFHHRQRLPRLFGKRTLGGIGFFVLYSLLQGMAPGVDNAAHVGGLLAGAALAWVLPERFDAAHHARTVRIRAPLAALLIAAATAAIVATAPRAPFDVSEAFAANAAMEHGLREYASAVSALEKEALEVKAGKLGEAESDQRSRDIHAPRFRRLVQELSAIQLPAHDPRAPLLAALLRFSQLLLEYLQMESHVVDGKLVSVDAARASAIETELGSLNRQISVLVARLKQKPAGR